MKKKTTRDLPPFDGCAFKDGSEGPCSAGGAKAPKGEDVGDFCFGCKRYVCEAHSRNDNLPFGGHDVNDHLQDDAEEE